MFGTTKGSDGPTMPSSKLIGLGLDSSAIRTNKMSIGVGRDLTLIRPCITITIPELETFFLLEALDFYVAFSFLGVSFEQESLKK